MRRLIPLGLCMALLGCLGGADDGADPATSSPSGTDTQIAAEVTVAPRVGFGQRPQTLTAVSTGEPAARGFRQQAETEEVDEVRAVFSPESYKRTEIFRMRLGVQR
jgi:hypothetical protein